MSLLLVLYHRQNQFQALPTYMIFHNNEKLKPLFMEITAEY